jgi:hypothetical protein
MRHFVRKRRVIWLCIAKTFKRRHLHMIRASAVIGHVAAAADIGSRRTCTRLAIAEIKGSGSVRVRDWPGCGRGVTWSSSTRHNPTSAMAGLVPW